MPRTITLTREVFGELLQQIQGKYKELLLSQGKSIPKRIKEQYGYDGCEDIERYPASLRAVMYRALRKENHPEANGVKALNIKYLYNLERAYKNNQETITIETDPHLDIYLFFLGYNSPEAFFETIPQTSQLSLKPYPSTNTDIQRFVGTYVSYITERHYIYSATFELLPNGTVRGFDQRNRYLGTFEYTDLHLHINLKNQHKDERPLYIIFQTRYEPLEVKALIGLYLCIGDHNDPSVGREIWIKTDREYDTLTSKKIAYYGKEYRMLEEDSELKAIIPFLTGTLGNHIQSDINIDHLTLKKEFEFDKLLHFASLFLAEKAQIDAAKRIQELARNQGFYKQKLETTPYIKIAPKLIGIYLSYRTDAKTRIKQSLLQIFPNSTVRYQSINESFEGYAHQVQNNIFISLCNSQGVQIAQTVFYLGNSYSIQSLAGVFSGISSKGAPVCGREIMIKTTFEQWQEAQHEIKLLNHEDQEALNVKYPNLTNIFNNPQSILESPLDVNFDDFQPIH